MTALPETITIAGATLTLQDTDDSIDRPMYCDNDSCVWLAKSGTWNGDFVIGAAHLCVSDGESLGDVMVQLEEMVAETRVALTSSMRGLDTDRRVRFYEHDFYVLSNFSAFSIQWMGLRFDTVEHAYHWMKFPGLPLQTDIRTAPSAHVAFKLAEQYRTAQRRDWADARVGVMRQLLHAKVDQHEYVRRKLLATGERELVEDSWRDSFWGWGPNRDGKNMLGQLWMEIRSALRGVA